MLLLCYALGLQDDQIVDGLVEGVNLNVTGGQTPCVIRASFEFLS